MMSMIASASTFFMSSLIYKVANQMVKEHRYMYVGWSFSKLKLELGYMHEAKSQQQNMSMSFSFAFFIWESIMIYLVSGSIW